ncbi:biotin-dependent carboxyltransferase family protein [Paenarthrobacter nitroguajacolicus]|uniref:biotin-dependent carboxyltransferase family protein n=1 Tax=Paenarthrobacter nitroguajacolicus TaxID=211146 RepID=UPI00248D2444|nr:biotin-dependent carboxyltransferase family protein [Paenarthrobacter nitroguajacolicus]MDI2034330.1 5-oxoprolinase subunit C [Paenarthrobacter nitroguajacolicus]
MGAVVVDPGSSSLVLDPEHVLDRASMNLANALLGNAATAPGLEVLVGGLKLRFVTGSAVAVTGAEGVVTLNGAELPLNKPVRVAPGAVLAFGPARFGIRYYVAVQGGFSGPLGGLHAGTAVAFGKAQGQGFPHIHQTPRRALDPERPVVARIARGPHVPNYDAGLWLRLTTEPWILSPESDRVGARLAGRPLEVASAPAPQAQPLAAGSVVLPASGLPVIALADRPATAKSPVIALVREDDLDLIGQARPGQMVHLLG